MAPPQTVAKLVLIKHVAPRGRTIIVTVAGRRNDVFAQVDPDSPLARDIREFVGHTVELFFDHTCGRLVGVRDPRTRHKAGDVSA